jgi:hypothetical protein
MESQREVRAEKGKYVEFENHMSSKRSRRSYPRKKFTGEPSRATESAPNLTVYRQRPENEYENVIGFQRVKLPPGSWLAPPPLPLRSETTSTTGNRLFARVSDLKC